MVNVCETEGGIEEERESTVFLARDVVSSSSIPLYNYIFNQLQFIRCLKEDGRHNYTYLINYFTENLPQCFTYKIKHCVSKLESYL